MKAQGEALGSKFQAAADWPDVSPQPRSGAT